MWGKRLLKWYESNGRHLSWRETSDPYKIWVSEIILQQTRIDQGTAYYHRFLERFPNVEALAAAQLDEVLKVWQGLGYYSRARNMHAAAQQIVSSGYFPTSYKDILQLKGVGEYTAAAIASFSYNLPYAVVDGNVFRVLARYFGIDVPIDTTHGKKYFNELATELLVKESPADYNQAIMDFGALQCVPQHPNCSLCPFAGDCLAFAQNRQSEFPVKEKKMVQKTRYFVYVYVRSNNKILLHQRQSGDIWQGLYEPLLLEFDKRASFRDVVEKFQLSKETTYHLLAENIKHVLTHRIIFADAYLAETPQLPKIEGTIEIEEDKRDQFAVPKLVSLIYEALENL